jgi:hypothetical protein
MRYAEAKWRPLTGNYDPGGIWVIGLVLHVMEGTLEGSDSWFRRTPTANDSGSSAHFGLAKDGRLWQWVDTEDKAWAQEAGNNSYVSVECEEKVGDTLTAAQLAALVRLVQWMHDHHGMPFTLANKPGERGLGYHAMGGVAWGNHPCPGAPIIAQRQAILNAAKGGTLPMFDPPIGPFCAMRAWVDGGYYGLGPDGAMYAFDCPPVAGANGQPYFKGRTAADFVHDADGKVTRNSLGGPTIVATSGETYALAPR